MTLRPLLYVLVVLGGAVVLLAFLIVLAAARAGTQHDQNGDQQP